MVHISGMIIPFGIGANCAPSVSNGSLRIRFEKKTILLLPYMHSRAEVVLYYHIKSGYVNTIESEAFQNALFKNSSFQESIYIFFFRKLIFA